MAYTWKLSRIITGHLYDVTCLCVDSGNTFFVSGSLDQNIKLWNLENYALRETFKGHTAPVYDLIISDRHMTIYSVGGRGEVLEWDIEEGRKIREYEGHEGRVNCVAFHPTADIFITGGDDFKIRAWDLRTRSAVHLLKGHTDAVTSLVAPGVEPEVISASMDKTVGLWVLGQARNLDYLTGHNSPIKALALDRDDQAFASASFNDIRKWNVPDGKFIHRFHGHDADISSVDVSAENELCSAAHDGTMVFWDWKKYSQLQNVKNIDMSTTPSEILACKFDQTGKTLITGESDHSIKVWKKRFIPAESA